MSNKIKVIIVGSNGLLGQNVVNLFASKSNFKVFAFSKGKNRNTKTANVEYSNVNIINAKNLDLNVRKIKPHFIINCAAMTNVDACELRVRECNAVNVTALRTLITSCKVNKTHLIHISTDFIFDGEKGNYKEEDKPNPLNYYGKSKLESEKLLQKSIIDFTILRTILVYGKVEEANRSNIVLWIKDELENNREIKTVNDQFRMPIMADDLAEACFLTVEHNLKLQAQDKKPQTKQTYHISSNKLLSIYEIALIVAKVFQLDKDLIKEITTSALRQKAIRPKKTGFILDRAVSELGFKSFSFEERLKCFKEKYFKINHL